MQQRTKQYTKCFLNLEMTLQECADEMNVSPQRVDELQRRALRKVKKALLLKFGDKITLEDLLPITKEEYLP